MTGERWSLERYRKEMGLPPTGGGRSSNPAPGQQQPAGNNRVKNATKVVIDRIRFDSKAEAAYYLYLLDLKARKEITYFLRQVPIVLPGGNRYRCDFLVFQSRSRSSNATAPTPAGYHEFIDVKGYETETFKIKRNEIHALYPYIFIRCVTKDQIDPSYIRTVNELAALEGVV